MWARIRITSQFARSEGRGFTVLELMITVAVLAILLGMAVPAYRDTIRNNQIAASSAALVTALSLARNEAMKRGRRVSVCAANANVCAAGTNWSNGWIVFVDDFGAVGVINDGDLPLQRWAAPPRGVAVVSVQGTAVSFTRLARAESAQQFTVTKPGCSGNQQRRIDVIAAGRIGLTRQQCIAS